MTRHTHKLLKPASDSAAILNESLNLDLFSDLRQSFLSTLLSVSRAQLLQHRSRHSLPAFHDQPPRTLGRREQQQSLQHSGQGTDSNRDTPSPLHRPSNQISNDLPACDEQTLHSDQPPPTPRRRDLSNIKRHDPRRGADSNTDDRASEDHDPDMARESLDQGAQDEEEGRR